MTSLGGEFSYNLISPSIPGLFVRDVFLLCHSSLLINPIPERICGMQGVGLGLGLEQTCSV